MKKYLQISEVEKLLGISKNVLRYIEKTNKKLIIHKIRGIRYYKYSDVEIIAHILGKDLTKIMDNKQIEIFSNDLDISSDVKKESSLNLYDFSIIKNDLEKSRNKLSKLLSN